MMDDFLSVSLYSWIYYTFFKQILYGYYGLWRKVFIYLFVCKSWAFSDILFFEILFFQYSKPLLLIAIYNKI